MGQKSADLLKIRYGPGEWAGALGDLGTFIPLFLSLVALNALPPGRSLILAGVTYICSSLFFRIPIPVQPLKAFAAIAIAEGLGMPYLIAGSLWMGLTLLVLVVTGRVEWLQKYFTRPIVKGIQLGVALMLIKKGFDLVISNTLPVLPGAAAGSIVYPGVSEFIASFWILLIPQIPLTLGNAVFAVSDVAHDYFGDRARRATPKNLSVSIAISNIVTGVVGGLPVCHGSGGLTAHYRFGSRSGGATIIIGAVFLLIGLTFSQTGTFLFGSIPSWVLGLMLLYVGVCHALLIRGLEEKRVLACVMGLIGLLTGNLAYSLALGLVVENAGPVIDRILPGRST